MLLAKKYISQDNFKMDIYHMNKQVELKCAHYAEIEYEFPQQKCLHVTF